MKAERLGFSSRIRAKFHYAIQVADLVSDLAFDKFVRVCDQFATFLGSKAGCRQVRAIATSSVGVGPRSGLCDLDSVTESGL